ncbi:hypothetical protein BU23DRAFT_562145 [Bimuria novae-zelandiae CBS 107.79]|uniref:Saccharopine dehydrogenase NADP binding domain-containing protein n=1 Tax=Bimuria novae-zelandiae CBS 107.79 TaxID=1447943 RepID=A0A6A5UK64_9PLEO|nr:hypothetical protein BU23DRAFT_562145 [Bimuria novae-zelandiae CBS 107.79]
MAQSRQYEIVLFGATGYTGKLTAEWISQHLPTDLKWAIAGRNTTKLQTVAEELKRLSPDRQQPDIETCELKEDQLTSLALKTRLIIATVGPFMFYGEPVLAACAKTGTHYLDCTGEVPWIHSMIPKYHAQAQSTGAIIIPECGLDSVPADILSYVLTRHVRKTLNAGITTLTMSFVAGGSGVSGGTAETVMQLFEHYSLKELGEAMKPWSLSPVQPNNPARSLRGSLLYNMLGLVNIPELDGLQTTWLMASVDRCITHRSWGLYEASAKSTSTSSLSYGPHFNFNEYMRAKSLFTGVAVNIGMALFGLLFAFPASRWILSPLIKRFLLPKPGEGPSRESMKKDFMNYKAVAIADTDKQEKVHGKLHLPHGGYLTTAQTLSAAAWVILRGSLADTEAGRLGGGILTPATLGQPFVEKLDEFGIKIQAGV